PRRETRHEAQLVAVEPEHEHEGNDRDRERERQAPGVGGAAPARREDEGGFGIEQRDAMHGRPLRSRPPLCGGPESIPPLRGGVFRLECGDLSPLLFCFLRRERPSEKQNESAAEAGPLQTNKNQRNKSGDKSPHSKGKGKSTKTEKQKWR